jgi:acetylornithine deacetylase/succinyl-diaminopimelate desuccinylase-like protein
MLEPIEKISAKFYPGIPVIPILQPGATDGQFLTPRGIPTYEVMGLFVDADLGNIHGLNERVRVASVYDGRDFMYELVRLYSAQPH